VNVTIADIVVMKRTVTLPDTCPKCERDFVKDGGLTYWEYQDQKRPAKVDEEGNVVCDTEAEHGPPEAGESFLECISLWCTCGQNLIDNNQVETGS
jgi:hypothetical protein